MSDLVIDIIDLHDLNYTNEQIAEELNIPIDWVQFTVLNWGR